jgi:hypothetical protein
VLAPMIPMYPGDTGPTIIVYPGSTDWAIGDRGTISVTSDGSSNGLFMKGFQRWLQPERYGIFLPVSATPTVSDSLVTV